MGELRNVRGRPGDEPAREAGLRHSEAIGLALLLAGHTVACSRRAEAPRFDVENVETRCVPRDGRSVCSVTADVRTAYRQDYLVVLAVREGDRDVRRVVVPVSNRRATVRLEGVEVEGAAQPVLAFVGFVASPLDARLDATAVVTTCGEGGEPGDRPGTRCRTEGRVTSSDERSSLVVVEVRPGDGERRWGLARVTDREGSFVIEWTPAGPAAVRPADVRVAVAGIVAAAPQQGSRP